MKRNGDEPRRFWFQFSVKAVMILTLVVAAYLAGGMSERRHSRELERRAQEEAHRAMMAEREARIMAEQSMQRANLALQMARAAEARLEAEREDSNGELD